MTNGLHPPSFLQGFFSLIALYLVSYTLGYILIGLFKVDSKAKIHREFSRLLIGFLFILFCYSIIITAGSTIMLGLLIPIIIVVVNKLYRTTEKSSFLPEKKIVFVHLFYLCLFFLVACLFNYNPISGNIIQAEGDDLIFGRYCEHLDLTGEENIYLDWFYPSDQGNSFYHYADLWGGAIVGRFSGLGYYFGLYFVSSTFFIIIASWAAFSFLESLGYTLNFVNTLVCSTLIVLTSITKFVQIVLFAPVYKLGITPLIYFLNKLDIKVLALGLHSKIAIVLILLFWSIRQFNLKDFRGGFLVLACSIILYSVMVPPILLSLILFSGFLIYNKNGSLKTVFLWGLPVYSSVIFLALFYGFSGGTGYDVRSTSSSDLIQFFLSADLLLIALKNDFLVLLAATAGSLLFLPLFFVFSSKSNVERRSFFANPVIIYCLVFAFSGMVCQFVFNRIGDSLQFWQIPFTVTLIAGLCWVFVVIFNKTGNYGLKLYSFSLIFILIVQNRPLEMNEISGERKIFLENILKETGPEYFKFAFFTIPPPHMSFWLSYFHVGHPLSMLAPHVKYYRPVCLSVREFPKEKNSFLQNMLDNTVRVADFNVYVEAQIRNGKFISLRESQLSFIRENKIQFAVFTSGYHPDSILASHFLPKFISPDGYKFCEFIDQPEI